MRKNKRKVSSNFFFKSSFPKRTLNTFARWKLPLNSDFLENGRCLTEKFYSIVLHVIFVHKVDPLLQNHLNSSVTDKFSRPIFWEMEIATVPRRSLTFSHLSPQKHRKNGTRRAKRFPDSTVRTWKRASVLRASRRLYNAHEVTKNWQSIHSVGTSRRSTAAW